jgi:hypothetical protein
LFPAPKANISDYEHPMTRAELVIVTKGFTVVGQRNFRLPFVPLLISSRELRPRSGKRISAY